MLIYTSSPQDGQQENIENQISKIQKTTSDEIQLKDFRTENKEELKDKLKSFKK